ncbi:MAG TPA: hypothetical protein VK694_06440 [Verrucomicrobiae bacterium]|nr:hypothetical protein [Verrucomicrobiae bacterium]
MLREYIPEDAPGTAISVLEESLFMQALRRSSQAQANIVPAEHSGDH